MYKYLLYEHYLACVLFQDSSSQLDIYITETDLKIYLPHVMFRE